MGTHLIETLMKDFCKILLLRQKTILYLSPTLFQIDQWHSYNKLAKFPKPLDSICQKYPEYLYSFSIYLLKDTLVCTVKKILEAYFLKNHYLRILYKYAMCLDQIYPTTSHPTTLIPLPPFLPFATDGNQYRKTNHSKMQNGGVKS